jgi:Arc/MetJ family transcription regulator
MPDHSTDPPSGERRVRLVSTGEELVDLEVLVTDEQFRELVRRAALTSSTTTVSDMVRRYVAEGLARED